MNVVTPAHASSNASDVPQGTRRIEMAAVFCIGCHSAASLNADRHCLHCELLPRSRKRVVSGPGFGERVRRMAKSALTSCGLLQRDDGPLTRDSVFK